MVHYKSHQLSNGLQVIVHEDKTTQIAVINLLYYVGSRDEDENKTGFAHLFEHLMFGGSVNIPTYDEPLQKVGGDNNAFTTPDFTNYYLTLPANNVETGFWLESDRMLSLSFDPEVLEVQRQVVIEEFKQRYLNQPYGDLWLKLRPLAYTRHPYRWPTIGMEIPHIEQATQEDVKKFFSTHYIPNNAILVVSGNVDYEEIIDLSEKWFGVIEAREKPAKQFPMEPPQKEMRRLTIEASVPADALYKVYHMSGRFDESYYAEDFLSDVLGRGKSSRLHQGLIEEKKYFSSINAYVTGSIDPGLLVIGGKLNQEIELEQAERAVDQIIQSVVEKGVEDTELEKVKNQALSAYVFSEVDLLNRSMNLAFGSLSGDPGWLNLEPDRISNVTKEQMIKAAKKVLRDENSSVLYYKSAG